MKGFIKDLWWLLLFQGIALLLFGLVTVVWPGATLVSLAVFFAIYMLVTGVIDILVSIGGITHRRAWFITLLLGIVEVAAAVYFLKTPGVALEVFIFTAGITFIVQGIFSIVASIIDTTDAGLRVLEIVEGVLGIIAGFIVFQNPVSAGIVFSWVLGVYGLIAGTIRIAAALSLRQTAEELSEIVGIRKPVVSK